MRKLTWTPEASSDLLDIVRYIARENPHAARRVRNRIQTSAESLARMPLGRPGRNEGAHEKLVRGLPYIIAYSLLGDDTVEILRIVHSARDWPE